MKPCKRAYVALIAAVAGTPLLARPALAQMRVDTSGHATDANNQVGSGGYNTSNPNQPLWSQYQNALLTNNASGGFGFRGHTFDGVNLGVGYTDPFAFRGLLAGQGVDQFISISTGVPTMAHPTASSSNYAAPPNPSGLYYGPANHSTPPPGMVSNPTGPGYIPPEPPVLSPVDTRIGAIDFSGSSQIIPKPYEMILPGQVDLTANPATPAQQMLAANPIFGVVNWTMTPQAQQQDQQNQMSSIFGQTPLQQGISPQAAQGLTQQQVSGLRQEIRNMKSKSAANRTNAGGSANSTAGQPLAPLLGTSSDSSQLAPTGISPQGGDFSTGQSIREYPVDVNLPSPSQQSAQYAKLRQNIDQYNSAHSMTDEQANRKFQEILRLRDQAAMAAENGSNVISATGGNQGTTPGQASPGQTNPGQNNPGQTSPGGLNPGEMNPGGILNPVQPTGSAPNKQPRELQPGFKTVPHNMGEGPGMGVPPVSALPIPIDNFAKDIPAKGLADLVSTGDADVQNGQYDKAIAAYNKAIDVVPNNPLILVARGIAEMGGGYYAQANSDLHLAITEDPAVLMAQYDLPKQLGAARLNKMIDELKDIATNSPTNTLHSFLLTFCYYNSRHVGKAAEWLQTTDRRSGGQDPAIIQMKKYWNFNDEAPLPALPAEPPAPAVKVQSAVPATRPAGGK